MNQQKAFDDLRRNLNKAVEDRIKKVNKVSIDIGEALADLGVHNCRERLNRATPKNSESEALIETIKSNIVKEENTKNVKSTFTFKVNPDPENLYLFLEYGTGLVGENNQHEEAQKVGWGYGIRRESYITRRGMTGWFFPKSWTYIDSHDENPVIVKQKYTSTSQWVKTKNPRYKVSGYIRKRPKGEKTTETTRTYENWVFSEGLRPVRYFYDTKKEIEELVSGIKSQTKDRILGDKIVMGSYSKGNLRNVSLQDWANKAISMINSKRL